jgi:ABC-type branched-subunit amino acid transport system substrate-binding protein
MPHMKPINQYIWLVLIAALISACAGSAGRQTGTQALPSDAESLVFQQAELSLSRQNWEQALSDYSRYLSQYPQGRYADQAFKRIGGIYAKQGDYDAARAFYQRLADDFPHSPLANEAHLAIIDMLVLAHQPDEAIAQARRMLAANPDEEMRRQLWQRLARQYADAGSIADAAGYAYLLYKSAPDAEKARWAGQLQETIGRLNDGDIEKLWDQMDDPMARSYLMYRHATVQVVMENYDEALELLTAFVKAYPDHAYAKDAAELITTLEDHLRFTPLTLGCLLPLSGPYKLYGQRALNGVELALSLLSPGDQANSVKLEIRDSASEDAAAVQGVRDLAAAGVGAIIGPIVAAPTAAREAQKLNIPMVTLTQKADVTAVGDYIFRHFITPQGQVRALVSYFIDTVGLRDFAIMYPKESYGQTFMTLFWDEVVRQGGRIVGAESYDAQQTDFAVTIGKLVGTYYPMPKDLQARSRVRMAEDPYFNARGTVPERLDDIVRDPVTLLTGLYFQDPDQDRTNGPALGRQRQEEGPDPIIDFDVLFIPDSPKVAALILPQLAYHDVRDIYLAGTNLWHSPQLIDMAQSYAQNAVVVDGFSKESDSPAVKKFVEAYQQIYGSEPGIIEAFAFDTARLLLNIIMRPGIHLRNTLRDAMLQAFDVDGVTGPTAFDENGEAIKSLSLLRIKGDHFLEIPRQ